MICFVSLHIADGIKMPDPMRQVQKALALSKYLINRISAVYPKRLRNNCEETVETVDNGLRAPLNRKGFALLSVF